MTTIRKQAQQGFVLVVVLWSIAALTIISGAIMARINSTLEQAYRMRVMAEREQQQMATEQTLLYLLAARSWNAGGADLGSENPDPAALPAASFLTNPIDTAARTLRFDGSIYEGIGDAEFAIQDTGATFSLLEPTSHVWHRFMQVLGVEPPVADRWLDEINDYQDLDSIPRLNGAEAETYRAMGLPVPPNRFMVSPYELRNLPFAQERPALTERVIRVSTISAGSSSANLNTSPSEILQLIHYLRAEDAVRVTTERKRRLITSISQASSTFGLVFQGGIFDSVWQPSDTVRIMLGSEGRQRRWITVTFTPNGDGHPWIIQYNHPVDLQHREQESGTADVFSASDRTPEATNAGRAPFAPDPAPPADSWRYYSTFFPAQL